jgi:ferredoxin
MQQVVIIHITKQEWEQISSEQQKRIVEKLKQAGIKLEIK